MPGSTYTPLATTTLGSAAASYTFSSISGSYTDLVLIASAQTSTNNDAIRVQFNGDTGSNYSGTQLYGDGTNAGSNRQSNQTGFRISNSVPNSTSFAPSITNIQNYSNATTYKTAISRISPVGLASAIVGLWRSTAAITSITIYPEGGGTLLTGSTFTLFGIAAA